MAGGHAVRFERKLIDTLYTEAMLLADEARDYFDTAGRADRDALTPLARVTFSCESLKVTTRLMHVIAWLLTQRAVAAGELTAVAALDHARRLGEAPVSDMDAVAALPIRARALVRASDRLHARVAQLDRAQITVAPQASPARMMMERLSSAF
jgi:regulator of CtrA degradation